MVFGMFHPSELLCSSRFDMSDRAMAYAVADLEAERVHLWLCSFKTDQQACGILMPWAVAGPICPVLALHRFLEFRT